MSHEINRKVLFIGLILIGLGFIIGRWPINETQSIKYIAGKVVHDTIQNPIPYLVEAPENPLLPTKPDTIKIPGQQETIIQIVDTAQIIAEYIKKNKYKEILFDSDTLGKLTISAEVQYNKMQSLDYSFTPVYKQITIVQKKVFTPFLTSSVNTFKIFEIGGGLYYNNLGFEVKYITDFKDKGLEIGALIKF
jgi:hypothetical protein